MEGQSLAKCRACGSTESAIWDSETSNAVCSSCGTVDDAQRLVSGEYYPTREQNAYSLDLFRPQGTGNSYAVRIKGAEWHLQNHLREHRKLISNVCTSLEFHGRDRAIHHFEAAMANGDYRWGRESKLVCAVAIAISMVEEKKPEPIPRIAELIGESPSAILRQWTHVISTLDLHIRPTSPLLLLAMLHAYLLETSSPPSTLPTCILNNLSSHPSTLSSALSTAERIASFFSLTNSFALLPSAPTTCGIFLIAIETEQGHALSLSTAAAFAECLGKRFGVKGSTVLSRRRSMMMIFSEWATLLPWASVPTFTADGRNLWTVNKMSVIIRCVSDVLQFQYELSNRRGVQRNDDDISTPNSNSQINPVVVDDEMSSEPPSRASPVDNAQPSSSSASAPVPIWWTSLKSRKRPRGSDSAQRMITMLLQPTSAHKFPALSPSDDPEDVQERLSRIELQVLYGADQHQYHQYPLSRLQALTLQRGGADNISDDELFEPGELEGYQNVEDDALLLGATHPEWDIVPVGSMHAYGNGGSGSARGISEKQRGKGKGKGGVKRSKADSVPIQVNYSDDDSGNSDSDPNTNDDDGDGDEYRYEGGEEGDSGQENMQLDDDDVDGPVHRRRLRRHSTQQRQQSQQRSESRSRASSGRRNRIAGTTDTRIRKNGADGDGDGGNGDGDDDRNGGVDTDGGLDTESKFPLGKDAYLASFGILPGWEGDDADTVRYFENMEEM